MRKSKSNVGKFTIISKKPKGQKRNVIYTITYQETGKPEVKEIHLIWLDFRENDCKWAFADGRESNCLSKEDKEELLEEMPKFQKGGSYRKSHSITYTKKELIRQEIKDKEYEIYNLQQQIREIEESEYVDLESKYSKLIDNKRLDKFEKGLRELVKETGYMVKEKCWAYNDGVIVYDTTNNLPVAYLRFSKHAKDGWNIDKLSETDRLQFIRNDTTIRDTLKE